MGTIDTDATPRPLFPSSRLVERENLDTDHALIQSARCAVEQAAGVLQGLSTQWEREHSRAFLSSLFAHEWPSSLRVATPIRKANQCQSTVASTNTSFSDPQPDFHRSPTYGNGVHNHLASISDATIEATRGHAQFDPSDFTYTSDFQPQHYQYSGIPPAIAPSHDVSYHHPFPDQHSNLGLHPDHYSVGKAYAEPCIGRSIGGIPPQSLDVPAVDHSGHGSEQQQPASTGKVSPQNRPRERKEAKQTTQNVTTAKTIRKKRARKLSSENTFAIAEKQAVSHWKAPYCSLSPILH